VRSAPSGIRFRSINRGSAMRLPLEGAEAWRGLTFLGIVSADVFAAMIDEKLRHIATTEWLKADLAADPTRALTPVEYTRPMLRKPLAFAPIGRELKAQRREARQKNKGKRPVRK